MSDISVAPVTQGDVVLLAYDVFPPQDMTGWSADVYVKREPDGVTLLNKLLTDISSDTFSVTGLFTRAETLGFPVGVVSVFVRLYSSGDALSSEISSRLIVSARGAYDASA